MVGKQPKRLVRRARADLDVLEAVDHCAETSAQAADAFVDALEKAYLHIRRHPATGSPRYAHELNLPGLRFWCLTRYPHLIFYVDLPDRIEVWRVLHGQRDVPAWLQGDPDPASA